MRETVEVGKHYHFSCAKHDCDFRDECSLASSWAKEIVPIIRVVQLPSGASEVKCDTYKMEIIRRRVPV